MRDVRTAALLAVGCLLAGVGPFVVGDTALQRLAAAAAFALPAVLPFFFGDRALGPAAVAVAVGLVLAGSMTGVFLHDAVDTRRALFVRNLQMVSAGAFTAAGLLAISWLREVARRDTDAA